MIGMVILVSDTIPDSFYNTDKMTGTKRWYEMNKTPMPSGYEKEQ